MNLINIQIILSSSPRVAELELDIDVRNVKMNLFIHSESICRIIYHPSHAKAGALAFVLLMETGKDKPSSMDSSRHQYCCRENEGW